MFFSIKKRISLGKRGFTLFELLVSISIFTLLTAVLLVKNTQFRGTTIINNVAYDLALSFREAQVYGVDVQSYANVASSSSYSQTAADVFTHGYGMHYDTYDSVPAKQIYPYVNQFTLFADSGSTNPDNLRYDADDVIVEIKTIPQEDIIQNICALGTTYCTNYGGDPIHKISSIDVSFKRPNPDAKISITTESGAVISGLDSMSIFLTPRAQAAITTNQVIKEIDVSSTGQISVNEQSVNAVQGTTQNQIVNPPPPPGPIQ